MVNEKIGKITKDELKKCKNLVRLVQESILNGKNVNYNLCISTKPTSGS